MPASQISRLLFSVIAAVLVFVLVAHTGMFAVRHLRSSSNDKVGAYQALVLSNANIAFCYAREVANFVAYAFRLVSHDALLRPRGFFYSTAEYGVNWAVQHGVRERTGIDHARGFDLRWPALSAAAEAVDVAFVSGAARLAEPERPVRIWRGRLAEGASAEADSPSRQTVIDAIDRMTQRAVGRQLVGELANVVPEELGVPGIGLLAAAGTHLRELIWQAENATRGHGARQLTSDLEATPRVGVSPNAGSSSAEAPALRQEGAELPSPVDLNTPPPDIAGPSSSGEAGPSFVDRSLEDVGYLVLGWKHGCQPAPPFLIGALNRRGEVPRTPFERANLRIHGQTYTAYLAPGSGVQTLDNPLGGNIMLVPQPGNLGCSLADQRTAHIGESSSASGQADSGIGGGCRQDGAS
ncbi:hypothetical protein [Bradyrhizobium macuxiense]|uniref:hypothetical protein n=1 Tax=Bradyrhizobium macuxiense TaxID=1755647 RepID=UPI0011BD64EC|nr:hypothetical protein [Bradyrhizobium macuxiense]